MISALNLYGNYVESSRQIKKIMYLRPAIFGGYRQDEFWALAVKSYNCIIRDEREIGVLGRENLVTRYTREHCDKVYKTPAKVRLSRNQ